MKGHSLYRQNTDEVEEGAGVCGGGVEKDIATLGRKEMRVSHSEGKNGYEEI